MLWHSQIIRFLKRDNKYEEGQVDERTDTKEEKKRLAKLIAEMKKAGVFEKNEQLSYISDRSAYSTITLDDLPTSSNSDSLGFFL